MNKIKVKSIKLGFSEYGPGVENREFNSWEALDAFLVPINREVEWDKSNGKLLGYYKTDFHIEFEDGRIYRGRYDIGSDQPTIKEHVRRFCSVYGFLKCPEHFSPERWEAFKKLHRENSDAYKEVIEKYDV